MYDRLKRKEKYQRFKNRELKKCDNEIEAYTKIKDVFILNDFEIRDLLRNYTVTEILEWEFEEGKFVPKDLIKIFAVLILWLMIFTCYYNYKGDMILWYEQMSDLFK